MREAMEPIVRIVQHVRSGEYLAAHGQWTAQVRAAQEFGSVREALTFCLAHGIRYDAQLLICVDDAALRVSLVPSSQPEVDLTR